MVTCLDMQKFPQIGSEEISKKELIFGGPTELWVAWFAYINPKWIFVQRCGQG